MSMRNAWGTMVASMVRSSSPYMPPPSGTPRKRACIDIFVPVFQNSLVR
jgi:hypothetical protein